MITKRRNNCRFFCRKNMSEAYLISSYAKNDKNKLCRFKTYKFDNMFVRAYHLAYYAYISYVYEKYRICIYPEEIIGQRYDLTFEQIAEIYDIVNCIKNKEYGKKIKKHKWLKIF